MNKNSATSLPSHYPHEEEDDVAEKVRQLRISLPIENSEIDLPIFLYQNFWCPSPFLSSVIYDQTHFRSQNTDILLVSKPKSGTTWLKSLAFTILNRETYPPSNQDHLNPHPLFTYNPHQLVPFMEVKTTNSSLNLNEGLFATHLPWQALPESVKKSECRIVYICRNILDIAISLRFHVLRSGKTQSGGKEELKEEESIRLERFLEYFCKGMESYGPHWDHVLGYWHESLRRPNKVLFMKYEDVKEDENSAIKTLAEFMGCPFSHEEEAGRAIEEISKLCSIGSLKEVEVNKTGHYADIGENVLMNNMFFRKGEVGDWVNHMSPSMTERLEMIMHEKLQGSGLTFKTRKT